jgi:hypothetical protein
MGNSYCNFTVRADQKKVVGFLKYARRPGFVSANENGCCVVCEPPDFDLNDRAADLSDKLDCVVLFAYNADDDLFGYELWKVGKLLDTHESGTAAKTGPGSSVIVRPDEWSPESDNSFPAEVERWANDEDGDEARIGEAAVLRKAFDQIDVVSEVSKVPSASPKLNSEYLWSHRYHAELVKLIGLPRASILNSFDSLLANEENAAAWVRV